MWWTGPRKSQKVPLFSVVLGGRNTSVFAKTGEKRALPGQHSRPGVTLERLLSMETRMTRFSFRLLQLAVLLLALAWLAPAQAQMRLKSCDTLDLKKLEVGRGCVTRSGAEFQRFRNAAGALGWRDMGPGGRVWYDEVKVNAAQVEADLWCGKKAGQSVPSVDDYEMADQRGFAEVIGDSFREIKNPLLYSSKVAQLAVGDRAIGYSVERHDLNGVRAEEKFDNALIICVSSSSVAP